MEIEHPEVAHAVELAGAGRNDEALPILARLAGEGNGEALFFLGDAYWRGVGAPQDYGRGRELFRQAAERGHPMAVRAYTNLLASGIAGPRDWQGALKRLREEARGDALRATMLSLIEKMPIDAQGDPLSLPKGERVSEVPLVVLFPAAFSREECRYLIQIAEPTFQPSLIVDPEKGNVRDPIRTSDGSTMHWLIEDPVVHAVNRRLAALSGTRADQGEPLQILRYRPGQEYRSHLDWLGIDKPRVLTALIYLNEDYGGGETDFPKAGFKVRGRAGDALIFRSVQPDGSIDRMSEHAGLPVTKGTKYLGSRWIRPHRHTA